MPAQTMTVTRQWVAAADAHVLSSFYPVPGLGLLAINAFLLRAREPVLVDCGPPVLRGAYLEVLRSVIDLEDIRWIYLTHADPDHVGCLREVLAAAPRAKVVTTFLGLGKLGLTAPIEPGRVHLLNPGQKLRVGDRELLALKPLTFDAPETTAFVDSRTRALFSSDSFGGVVAEPAERASDIMPGALRDGVVTWATVDSPWLASIESDRFQRAIGAIRQHAPPVVLSAHLPPAIGMTETLLGHVADARTAPPFVGPDQKAFLATLEAADRAAE